MNQRLLMKLPFDKEYDCAAGTFRKVIFFHVFFSENNYFHLTMYEDISAFDKTYEKVPDDYDRKAICWTLYMRLDLTPSKSFNFLLANLYFVYMYKHTTYIQ